MVKKILLKTRSERVLYTLIGITCHLMDYRILYLLNKELRFNFTKEDDLKITLTSTNQSVPFSFYSYKDEDQRISYYLIANFSQDVILVPEVKHADFIMLMDGDIKKQKKEELLKTIRSITRVITAFEIKFNEIKNPAAFLADVEMHILNISNEIKLKNKTTINK